MTELAEEEILLPWDAVDSKATKAIYLREMKHFLEFAGFIDPKVILPLLMGDWPLRPGPFCNMSSSASAAGVPVVRMGVIDLTSPSLWPVDGLSRRPSLCRVGMPYKYDTLRYHILDEEPNKDSKDSVTSPRSQGFLLGPGLSTAIQHRQFDCTLDPEDKITDEQEDDKHDYYIVHDSIGVSHIMRKQKGEHPALRCVNCSD
jgi:hypothetical protein